MRTYTIVYNTVNNYQHSCQTDDEQLAKYLVSTLTKFKNELVFYPTWDDTGMFTGHKGEY